MKEFQYCIEKKQVIFNNILRGARNQTDIQLPLKLDQVVCLFTFIPSQSRLSPSFIFSHHLCFERSTSFLNVSMCE